MLRLAKLLVCLSMMCLWSGWASASVIYDFKAFSSYPNPNGVSILNGSFQLTVPTFITSDANFYPDQLDSGSIVTSDPNLTLDVVGFTKTMFQGYDIVTLGTSDGWGWYYYFDATAFSTLGKHDTVLLGTNQFAQLDVRETGTPVPDPSTFILLGTGLAGVGFFRKRIQKLSHT